MPLFTPEDMQTFADLITDLAMDLPCTIERSEATDVPYGSKASPPVIVIETVCLLEMLPVSTLLQAHDDKLGTFAKWMISFPLGTGPQEGDVVTVNEQKMLIAIVLTPASFSATDDALASEIL